MKTRQWFHLIRPDGAVILSSGKRSILEKHLLDGWYKDEDDNNNEIIVRLPEGCTIVEHKEE